MNSSRFSFLILLCVLLTLVAMAAGMSQLSWQDFFQYFDFWKNTLCLGVLLGFLLGTTGFWLVAKQSIYSGLAISASSVVGLLTAAYLMEIFSIPHSFLILPGLILGILIYLGGTRFFKNIALGDTTTAIVYVTCTAVIIIISNNSSLGHHELENFLFGNSVTVTDEDFIFGVGSAALLIMVALYFRKSWLDHVFDPLFAHLNNHRSGFYGVLLQITIATTLIIGAKNFGMLTTFSILLFASLPAYALATSGTQAFFFSGILGAFIFPSGFVISFFLDQPTGACICGLGFLMLIITQLIKQVVSKNL